MLVRRFVATAALLTVVTMGACGNDSATDTVDDGSDPGSTSTPATAPSNAGGGGGYDY